VAQGDVFEDAGEVGLIALVGADGAVLGERAEIESVLDVVEPEHLIPIDRDRPEPAAVVSPRAATPFLGLDRNARPLATDLVVVSRERARDHAIELDLGQRRPCHAASVHRHQSRLLSVLVARPRQPAR
jgi:hypothetical protein